MEKMIFELSGDPEQSQEPIFNWRTHFLARVSFAVFLSIYYSLLLLPTDGLWPACLLLIVRYSDLHGSRRCGALSFLAAPLSAFSDLFAAAAAMAEGSAAAFVGRCSSFPCNSISSRSGCRRLRPQASQEERASAPEFTGLRTVNEHPTSAVQRPAASTSEKELEVMYDDGFGSMSVLDYFDASRAVYKLDDGGPPRWFCPAECTKPIDRAPLLLFLPGIDGVGMGLIMHHQALGKVFEVRCLHVPIRDRTPLEGLLQIVERTLKEEQALSPNRPIYLVGDSFGGCLALSVGARNPDIDLALVIVNPATSVESSYIQLLFPLLEVMPSDLHNAIPYLLSFALGDPLKMAMACVPQNLSPSETLAKLSCTLSYLIPLLSEIADIVPRETLLWKIRLLKSAAAYANSRLHAVGAEVLVLASGKDNLLPSAEEADRLWKTLKKCRVRLFKDSGHILLMESGVNLLSIIKGTGMYRRSRQRDPVTDHLPPTLSEYKKTFGQDLRIILDVLSPVVLSTMKNGKIVHGLSGLPDGGPVMIVGYHMMMGCELAPLWEAFLKEMKVQVHGLAHPVVFSDMFESSKQEPSPYDTMTMYGAIPVTPLNMYRLLQRNKIVLLYPGGAREALHRKGEEYKLFWPNHPEFVRMAAKFGATIVPFGAVGEDDLTELVLDYDDLMRIPFVREWIEDLNKNNKRPRETDPGEEGNQDMHLPLLLPKIPGRFYYIFGKPIELDSAKVLHDKQHAMSVYLQVKSEVENLISYLRRKREEDPYRSITQRALYHATMGPSAEVPTFEL